MTPDPAQTPGLVALECLLRICEVNARQFFKRARTQFLSKPVKSFSGFLTTISTDFNSNVCRQLENRRV
jgi:hypothetical protein